MNVNEFNYIFTELLIEGTDSPIIFYKVKHEYMLSGAYHCDEVVLDSKYQLVKQ